MTLLLLLCGCSAHIEARGLDAVTAPGAPVRVGAKFERASVDLRREPVVFRIAGRTISDLTDLDGVAQATVRFAKPGVYEFVARLPERERVEARGHLFVADRPLVVCDIDGTISDMGLLRVALEGDRAPTFPGAPELLRDLAKRYQIVYLTARDDVFDRKTRAFLSLHAFPTGPVLYNDWGLRTPEEREQLRASQHGKFKLKVLRALEARGLKIAFAIGDADTDAEAYAGAGVPGFIRREEPDGSAPAGNEWFPDYAALRARLAKRGLLRP